MFSLFRLTFFWAQLVGNPNLGKHQQMPPCTLAHLGDWLFQNIFKISLKSFVSKVEKKSNLTKQIIAIYYYVNVYF
jgi:hypothetical protein